VPSFFQRPAALLTTPVRLTLAFTALYIVGTLLIFVFLDYQLRVALVGQVNKSLLDQQNLLTVQHKEAGFPAMFRAIRGELLSRGQSDRTYRVFDANGAKLLEAGELQLPVAIPAGQGIHEIQAKLNVGGEVPVKARMLSFTLPGNIKVQIAKSMQATDELMASFRSAFMTTVALILLLGLAGGWWLAKRFWNQIESFNQMAMKIVNSGNLASRMPVTGNDEFSVLATNMNAMLDKMEKLFQGIRQVSDNIAHDLRSPLTRLRADVEVTLQENDPQLYRLTLERVLTELQNMQEIFQSLLSLGQAEAGSLKIRKKPLDLSQLLEDIVELYGPLSEDKGQAFDANIDARIEIEGDRQLLAQALSNLLDNAVKYVPEGGQIVLSAVFKDDKAVIRLDDSGPGIPQDMRRKVFDRFVRVDPSRTLPGTGLGLSLVKAFIELHQGNITLSDSKLGGTSFIIVLPVK